MVTVDVVYIPRDQKSVRVACPFVPGMRVCDVLEQSGLVRLYPEIVDYAVGIFAQVVPVNTLVKLGDRIEIYRPLLVDPKEKRRQRARGK